MIMIKIKIVEMKEGKIIKNIQKKKLKKNLGNIWKKIQKIVMILALVL